MTMCQTRSVALSTVLMAASLAASVFPQGVGAQSDAHRTYRTHPTPPVNNQFNLPAYLPMLMPYSPPLGAPIGGEQRTAPHHPVHPRVPQQEPIAPAPPAQVAYFCPPLGGYFPMIPHCPTPWMQVVTDPARRYR